MEVCEFPIVRAIDRFTTTVDISPQSAVKGTGAFYARFRKRFDCSEE